MPHTNFTDEFNLRYIKDGPMVSHSGQPFFPQYIDYNDHYADGYKVKGRYITPKLNKISKVVDLDSKELGLSFPSIGWRNVSPEVCGYFYIQSSKQYRFALSPHTFRFIIPNEYILCDVGIDPDSINPWGGSTIAKMLAVSLIKPKYYTLRQAYTLLATKHTHLGAAFSKDLALIVNHHMKHPIISYRGSSIGLAISATTALISDRCLFMKETLQEHFKEVMIK